MIDFDDLREYRFDLEISAEKLFVPGLNDPCPFLQEMNQKEEEWVRKESQALHEFCDLQKYPRLLGAGVVAVALLANGIFQKNTELGYFGALIFGYSCLRFIFSMAQINRETRKVDRARFFRLQDKINSLSQEILKTADPLIVKQLEGAKEYFKQSLKHAYGSRFFVFLIGQRV